MKIICDGWFTSVLSYCLPLYGGCDQRSLLDLQVMQNKVARLATRSKYDRNRSEMFEELGWFTVNQLIMYHTILTTFRIRATGEPEMLASLLAKENRNNRIIPPNTKMTLFRKSFICRDIGYWNSLPSDVRSLENARSFKIELKKWIHMNISKFKN